MPRPQNLFGGAGTSGELRGAPSMQKWHKVGIHKSGVGCIVLPHMAQGLRTPHIQGHSMLGHAKGCSVHLSW